tara:strand:+ start:280 stop:666 length:387 start_codon:yes stop_codon:yes gene_type:complete
LNTANPKKSFRWVLLRHTDAPDDSRGIHFDLLIEDDKFCRTWRLSDVPLLDGPYVDSVHIAPHSLDWLEIEHKVVSGNKGVATRVKRGIYLNSLPSIEKSCLNLTLEWENIEGDLVINENGCRILSKK